MKTTKFWLATIATLLCSLTASAHDFEVGGIYYNITSSASLTVEVTYGGSDYNSYSNEYSGAVIIPSSVTYSSKTYGVTSIGESAFRDCDYLTAINIPEGVTSIGSWAFYGCSSLTAINIPENSQLTSIGESAFRDCDYLTAINIPESVTSIGSGAFRDCDYLTAINIPEGVTSIGSWAFYGCSSLTAINIPEGVTSIGSWAFYGCSSLTAINIPESVTSIGIGAFEDCTSLTAINIPESVTSIGSGAFEDCTSLTAINIPEGVTSIGYEAFYNCSSLTSITIPESVTSIGDSAFEGTAWYNSLPDGLVYIGKVLHKYKGTMPENTSIGVKEGIVSISPQAFRDCSSLTAINIPESVTSIGSGAFEDCTSLTAINIPEGVTSIGYEAFYNCSSLTSITIPESVTSIGDSAFEGCRSLYKVINFSNLDIQKGSTEHGMVGYYAQKVIKADADDNVKGYYFYTSEENIHYLFHYGGKETALTLPEDYNGDDYIIDYKAFANNGNIISASIPQTVGEIGSHAFAGCSNLASVDIARGVMSIGDNAFENCTSLTAIIFPKNLTAIGSSAFKGCSGLTSIGFDEDLERIGDNAFENCTSLTAIIFPKNLTAIGSSAFKGCSGLTSIGFDEDLERIGDNAFENCTSLTTIIFPKNLTAIGSSAFKGCSGLTSVFIGANVDTYGKEAFEGCEAVETLMVMGSVMPTIPSDKLTSITLFSPVPLKTSEFANKVYRNATVYVPKGSLERYQAADVWKNFWTIKEFDSTQEMSLSLDQTAATLTEDESLTLTASITPEFMADMTVTWSTSDAAVATVDEHGVVTALAAGTATIIATTGGMQATCVVTVTKKEGEVVGIENSEIRNHESEIIYDLSGRRVEKMEKGIYIVGGKKVVIK